MQSAPVPSSSVGKKGVGVVGDTDLSVVSKDLNCSWYYNWLPEPTQSSAPHDLEWVPMIWSGSHATHQILESLQSHNNIPALLTFNEPDRSDQANMSVDEAIELWPALMETGLRLGSPAPSAGIRAPYWLDRFMKKAAANGYRVDFVCLHYYGDINGSDAIPKFERWLKSMHRRYGERPIWLTEDAAELGLRKIRPERAATFAKDSVALLESLPFIERYAWFATHIAPNTTHASDFIKSSLLKSPDTLTPVGKAYATTP